MEVYELKLAGRYSGWLIIPVKEIMQADGVVHFDHVISPQEIIVSPRNFFFQLIRDPSTSTFASDPMDLAQCCIDFADLSTEMINHVNNCLDDIAPRSVTFNLADRIEHSDELREIMKKMGTISSTITVTDLVMRDNPQLKI